MKRRKPSRKAILHLVCADTGISAQQMVGHRRLRPIAHARQNTMYLMRTMRQDTFPEIGMFLGGRDHTTALFGVQQVEQRIEYDAGYAKRIEAYTAALQCPAIFPQVLR